MAVCSQEFYHLAQIHERNVEQRIQFFKAKGKPVCLNILKSCHILVLESVAFRDAFGCHHLPGSRAANGTSILLDSTKLLQQGNLNASRLKPDKHPQKKVSNIKKS